MLFPNPEEGKGLASMHTEEKKKRNAVMEKPKRIVHDR